MDDWRGSDDLTNAMRVLEGLWLSGEPRQREAFRRRYVLDGTATAIDVERARGLLHWLVRALTDAEGADRWKRLEEAAQILGVRVKPAPQQGPPQRSVDTTEAPATTSVDTTLPAVTEAQPDMRFDVTLSMNSLTIDDDEPPDARGKQQRTARGTLLAGETPDLDLDVDKYAVLCAWTEIHPQRRTALHEQYGLAGEEARAELDRRFEARFVSDPKLRVAFTERLRMHLSWLRGAGS